MASRTLGPYRIDRRIATLDADGASAVARAHAISSEGAGERGVVERVHGRSSEFGWA